MRKHNPENERIKRDYLVWLKQAQGQSEATLDAIAAALHRFEEHTRQRPFKSFRPEQATSFKLHLSEQVSAKTGDRLSKATLYATLKALRAFFQWLSREPGFRSRVNYSDADYFNLTANDVRIAKATRETPVPSLEQVLYVLRTAPTATVIERRDRAVIAFTLLTGARDGATPCFKLKHIDIDGGELFQDARDVQTKRRKTFKTWFFPIDELPRQIVSEWVAELTRDHLFGTDDPLFPATSIGLDSSGRFEAKMLGREPWSNSGSIRKIFRQQFQRAGLTYFNPHSIRNLIAQIGEVVCPDLESYKAWSQNLGHESMVTTLGSYGAVSPRRQAEIIRSLPMATSAGSAGQNVEQVLHAAIVAARARGFRAR